MKLKSGDVDKKILRKNKIKKYLRNFIYIIIIPIILCNITLIVQSFIKRDETPNLLGYKTYVIVSGSMEPNLNIGDIVIVKKTNKENIQKGDIISFREGTSIVTHRVVEIVEEDGNKLFKTKGDNNNVEDKELVKYEQIEGEYYKKIQGLGKIALMLKNKIVIIIVFLMLGLMYSHNMKMEKKRLIRLEKRKTYEKEREKSEEIK